MNIFNRTFVMLWTLDTMLMVVAGIGFNTILNYIGVPFALPISVVAFVLGVGLYIYLVILTLKRWGYIGNRCDDVPSEEYDYEDDCEDDYENDCDGVDEEPTEPTPTTDEPVGLKSDAS